MEFLKIKDKLKEKNNIYTVALFDINSPEKFQTVQELLFNNEFCWGTDLKKDKYKYFNYENCKKHCRGKLYLELFYNSIYDRFEFTYSNKKQAYNCKVYGKTYKKIIAEY